MELILIPNCSAFQLGSNDMDRFKSVILKTIFFAINIIVIKMSVCNWLYAGIITNISIVMYAFDVQFPTCIVFLFASFTCLCRMY